MKRDPDCYLELPYGRVWEWREDDSDPHWVVRLVQIPEVAGDGTTRDAAEAALRECLADCVRYRQPEGLPVPEPTPHAAAG